MGTGLSGKRACSQKYLPQRVAAVRRGNEARTHAVADGIRTADSDATARELAGTGVTAHTVAQGVIVTEPPRDGRTGDRRERLGWTSSEPASDTWFPSDIGRFSQPEEIAAAVTFLASKHAGYIMSTDVRDDGGIVRTVN